MVRVSKQQERRMTSPRRPSLKKTKTGPKVDLLEKGFKQHSNAIKGAESQLVFIPKIR